MVKNLEVEKKMIFGMTIPWSGIYKLRHCCLTRQPTEDSTSKINHLFKLLTVAIVVMLIPNTVRATTVNLGATSAFRILSQFPTNHDPQFLGVYNDGTTSTQHSIILFNLSSIPSGATINSATLNLTAWTDFWEQPPGGHTDVYAIARPWDSTANWIKASNGVSWSSPGGDVTGTVFASNNQTIAKGINYTTPMAWDVTSLVSNWYSGSLPNYGMLLAAPVGVTLHFIPSSASISVTYTAAPIPSFNDVIRNSVTNGVKIDGYSHIWEVGTFKPNLGYGFYQAANLGNFTTFNWYQTIVSDTSYTRCIQNNNDCLNVHKDSHGNILPMPHEDPPLDGTLGLKHDNIHGYFDAGDYSLPGSGSVPPVLDMTNNSFNFRDRPCRFVPGDTIVFHTFLMGVDGSGKIKIFTGLNTAFAWKYTQLTPFGICLGVFNYATQPDPLDNSVGQLEQLGFVGINNIGANELSYIAQQGIEIISLDSLGDLNGDGLANCVDIKIIKDSFGKRTGQAGFDIRADVNKDGVVDIRDLSFVSRQLPTGTKCS